MDRAATPIRASSNPPGPSGRPACRKPALRAWRQRSRADVMGATGEASEQVELMTIGSDASVTFPKRP